MKPAQSKFLAKYEIENAGLQDNSFLAKELPIFETVNEVRVILVLVTHFTNRYLCDTNYFYSFRSDYWFCRNTSENKNA